jgi:acetate kinase
MFARRGAACIGAAMTTLPMLDGLVFTGGIGEHSASMRGEITRRLLSLGIPLADAAISASSDGVLVAGPPAILVVEAREDLVIAEEVTRIVSA